MNWDNNKDALLAALDRRIEQSSKKPDLAGIKSLAEIFFHGFPAEDLRHSEAENLHGFIFSAYRALQAWSGDEALIRVFNPDLEQHGWQSEHTSVLVLARDMPFLLDSVRGELNRRNANIHILHGQNFGFARDEDGRISNVSRDRDGLRASLLYFEIDRRSSREELDVIASTLQEILREVDAVVADFPNMRAKLAEVSALVAADEHVSAELRAENHGFLSWLAADHMTLLGYECLVVAHSGGAPAVREDEPEQLGLLRLRSTGGRVELLSDLTAAQGELGAEQQLMFSKSRNRSRVHRFAYPDYIEINLFDALGRVVVQHRFMGLYTFSVYSESPTRIPVLKPKVAKVMALSGLDDSNHEGRELARVLELFPREELFHASVDELYRTASAINRLQERRRTRLFIRHDAYQKFSSCMVYMPRDRYTTEKRIAIQELLCESLGAEESEFTTTFTESVLVRIHFVLLIASGQVPEVDEEALESAVIALSEEWTDRLRERLLEEFGEEAGAAYAKRFLSAFAPGYRSQFEVRTAVRDIAHMDALSHGRKLSMSLYRHPGEDSSTLRFRLFSPDASLPLSDVLPVLENLGLRVLAENPYEVKDNTGQRFWIQDFKLQYGAGEAVELESVRDEFTDAFERIWFGEAESDGFNKLLLGTRLSWREVALLRAYAKYLKQINFAFSIDYIAETLLQHLHITGSLVELFLTRFDPGLEGDAEWRDRRENDIQDRVITQLEQVENLGQDRIFRQYLALIGATLRTNFFQVTEQGKRKGYFSFKLSPGEIPHMPRPHPAFEIFVYSPTFEGVHLRGGKVARGGLRWSDRLEDFRTEVLGLVKAQQVKNAVIVPVGAKGGFVAKRLPVSGDQEAIQAEGISCYRTFIRGLLDITDNVVDGETVSPANVIAKDDHDPYLVVAADKGTATFSDIANGISAEYGHWLRDAFASGGSVGYDHKKMGITARGAWVSVQRHFRELGLNCQEEAFTAVGIGDMAGDVFGNGMLLSRTLHLVAAFNHQHIFVDPNPDAEKSFAERRRLFDLGRGGWDDYDATLISAGGGVFSRQSKAIPISAEIRERLAIDALTLTPNELITACLKAPVDLLWNGGIGTYVKASSESHADVGDKANDTLRINGEELRCKVVGEGGNLGLTQLGRVEYALSGGRCNTDFIDNAAGVDCSDHEVNIKILLNAVVDRGDLTEKHRNQLLEQMTDSVAERVLDNNYLQTQAISLAESESARRLGEYGRLISLLETHGRLDRQLEHLPGEEALAERRSKGLGLTRPELSVLVSYSKAILKEQLAAACLQEDDYLAQSARDAFPAALIQQHGEELASHSLRREIVATQIANDMINRVGVSFVGRLMTSTGATATEVSIAYVTARDVYQLPQRWAAIEALDYQVAVSVQIEMMIDLVRLLRRSSRWLLRNRRQALHPAAAVDEFKEPVASLEAALPELLPSTSADWVMQRQQSLCDRGVDEPLARYVAQSHFLAMAPGIVQAAQSADATVLEVAELFFKLGDLLDLDWFAQQISQAKIENEWQALARDTYLEDLEWQQRSLAVGALQHACELRDLDLCLQRWMAQEEVLINRWRSMVANLRASAAPDFAMFAVANRELLDLAQSSLNPAPAS